MKAMAEWIPVRIRIVVAAALSGVAVWLKLRRRTQLGEGPPQGEKLLRPPGYQLQEELERIQEALTMSLFQLLGSGAVGGHS